MPAVPVGCSLRWSTRSMPSATASARASCAPTSSPSAHTNRVDAPARAAATAWLKPLPPGPAEYAPTRVSPGCGNASQRHTWSTLKDPTTTTRVMRRSPAEVGQHARDGRGHEGRDRTAEHRAKAEAREVAASFRREPADAADLDRD